MSAKKPTVAQLRWLRAIQTGKVMRMGLSWVNGMQFRGPRSVCPARSTFVMTMALHEAGWIAEAQGAWVYEVRMELTAQGSEVMGASEKRTTAEGEVR